MAKLDGKVALITGAAAALEKALLLLMQSMAQK